MNTTSFRSLAIALFAISFLSSGKAAVVTINGQTNGPTPFIKVLNLTVSPAAALDYVDFKIYPKPGSETRPVYVRYAKAYLQSLGLYNPSTGAITVSVFGLYENYNNRVALVTTFVDQISQRNDINVQTPVWTDTGGYKTPAIAKARTPNTPLSYDFVLLRGTPNTPIIIDTDGAVRWVGATNVNSQSCLYFNGAVYFYSGTVVMKSRFDGTVSAVVNLASQDVVGYHHNFEYGRTGVLVQTDTSHPTDPNRNQVESTIFEISGAGVVLKRWNFSKILRDAILEDATQDNFVKNQGQTNSDWFHNNSSTYRPSDNTLVVSSRENFVVAVDYDTGVLKWILGDTTKQWYVDYPSLRPYALAVDQNLVPMGQHAVHVRRDRLSFFNNGEYSYNHPTNPGGDRNFSMGQKFYIDTIAKTATEIFNYNPTPRIDSSICASFYEDASRNYFLDFAQAGPVLIGLDSAGNKVFDYRYTNACGGIYNAIPIHLENMRFN